MLKSGIAGNDTVIAQLREGPSQGRGAGGSSRTQTPQMFRSWLLFKQLVRNQVPLEIWLCTSKSVIRKSVGTHLQGFMLQLHFKSLYF